MNRIIRLRPRVVFAALLLAAILAGLRSSPAHADPSLPIVTVPSVYTIDIYPRQHRLVVKAQGQQVKTYAVAVGNLSTPTPVGEFQVIYKGKDWGPAFGPRWLGLNVPWGTYGIHGTNRPQSIGQHQSHGCVRMRNRDVTELYEMIPVGTKVTIYGHVLGDPDQNPRSLAEGDIGGDVQLIQTRLRSAGYYKGISDGRFRSGTTAAVKAFQRDHRLPVSGVVSRAVYEALGLVE
ncbi:hypothetical protein J31TS4_06530 [Paenibacillus sp. J31TS4]|uniref:L,D-transpeptidase family protein n=1 Tax=Paenibacillus sp. J31TS4 TaxID=2807195 RepID=UPI001B0A828A|nr:L,D-transpeptidase family protein [Paenibacillus sp. J31TS4]GIP37373.1 hypothetical protein J31TS4_06530 [Paenibacillus sp. J31TS4]